MEFNYLLNCFENEADFAELHREQLNLQTEFMNYKVKTSELIEFEDRSFVKLSDNMAFSTLKPTKNSEQQSCIFRFFNPSDKEETAEIEFAFDVKVAKCLLNEKELENFGAAGKKFSLKVSPWEIVTLKLTV